jgi:preprotein translocase subunit SecY
MDKFFIKLKHLFSDKSLRNKILFVLGSLIVFRLLASIPIPGVDQVMLDRFLNNNQFFGLLSMFSGGGLSTLSIVMLGVSPYITASIIMQLSTMMSPRMKAMISEEGDVGRKKFSFYSRVLTVPLAVIEGFGFLALLQKEGIVGSLNGFGLITNVAIILAGSMVLMWVGELVSEFGIGNGVSLIIFAGIVSQIPQAFGQLQYIYTDASQIPLFAVMFLIGLAAILGVVYMTEAERPVPVTYAKQVRGGKIYGGSSTYLPFRLNQAGVIPIIFALSILLLPQMVFNMLAYTGNPMVANASKVLASLMQNPWIYSGLYFILVFFFTYFYTAVTFDPKTISENLQKSGAFIPGVRPGEPTTDHLAKMVGRLTLVGALFLGLIAVLPPVLQAITSIQILTIGGTSLLIVVQVVIDLIKKVDAQLAMREY